jgi:hypothetical protein
MRIAIYGYYLNISIVNLLCKNAVDKFVIVYALKNSINFWANDDNQEVVFF